MNITSSLIASSGGWDEAGDYGDIQLYDAVLACDTKKFNKGDKIKCVTFLFSKSIVQFWDGADMVEEFPISLIVEPLLGDLWLGATGRGFSKGKFQDAYGLDCSLQQSSSVVPHIWFGSENEKPEVMNQQGHGWQKVFVEGDVVKVNPLADGQPTRELVFHNRMHLNQQMVKDLLPHLIRFANTGQL
jgi:hypothetical protein